MEPRKLSPALKFKILFLSSGSWTWVIGLTLIAASIMMNLRDATTDLFAFSASEVKTTQGIVVEADDTNVTVNDRTVSYIAYRFSVNNVEFGGLSYGDQWYPKADSTVTVEYLVKNPLISRIEKTHLAKVVILPVIVVVIGVLFCAGFVFFVFRKKLRQLRLLQHGVETRATFSKKTKTNMSVNEQPVYKLSFTFRDQNGANQTVSVKTHDTERFTDEKEETVYYDPKSPSNAFLLDELPKGLKYVNGNWEGGSLASIIGGLALRLFLPVVLLNFA